MRLLNYLEGTELGELAQAEEIRSARILLKVVRGRLTTLRDELELSGTKDENVIRVLIGQINALTWVLGLPSEAALFIDRLEGL